MTTPSSPRRGSFGQWLFAWMMARSGNIYEANMHLRKQALFGRLHGHVLELGPGTGQNLRYYSAGVRWTGVEPNPFMHPYLRQAIERRGWPADRYRIVAGETGGFRLPAEDASVDGVAETLVLCSVPDPAAMLREVRRVLKPGGQFVFVEHVAAPRGTRLRSRQNFVQPLWTLLADGCHPNRETWTTIAEAGFAGLELEHFSYPDGGMVAPHIAGVALR